MRIRSMRPVEPVESRCISVDSDDRLFAAGGESGVGLVSHNSVIQRNIVFGCIMRPNKWRFIGIDLKKVELSSYRAYSDVVLGIATTLEDALICLRFAQETMMKRYAEMEQVNVQKFTELPDAGHALMVMVDEAGELLSPSGVKTDEGKQEDELKGEASQILGSIARLGRAAGVHLVIATQRPDATIIKGELKANLPVRICAGSVDSTASSMILDNSEGTRIRSAPRGRMYLMNHQAGDHAQGFFADTSWIDEYRASKGLAPDGTPLSGTPTPEQDEEPNAENPESSDNDAELEVIEDDDGWSFSPNDDTVESQTQQEPTEGEKAGLILKGSEGEKDKFHHPEDDWDDELDAVVADNTDTMGR